MIILFWSQYARTSLRKLCNFNVEVRCRINICVFMFLYSYSAWDEYQNMQHDNLPLFYLTHGPLGDVAVILKVCGLNLICKTVASGIAVWLLSGSTEPYLSEVNIWFRSVLDIVSECLPRCNKKTARADNLSSNSNIFQWLAWQLISLDW